MGVGWKTLKQTHPGKKIEFPTFKAQNQPVHSQCKEHVTSNEK